MADEDLVVRPKVMWRVTLPAGAVLCVLAYWFSGSLWWLAGGLVVAIEALAAWRTVIVVIGPTLLYRNTIGQWTEVRLDHLRRVDVFWGGKHPTLHLDVVDQKGGQVLLGSRIFWERAGWQRLYALVWDAVSSSGEMGTIIRKRSTERRLRGSVLPRR